MFWKVFSAITLAKLLFIPAYRSTDFEVHRNWLAITHSLPLKEWYVDATSPWTLDYPPLFAWFEYLLSQLAGFFDSEMLVVQNLNYASQNTILFQRLSVIATDVIYAIGVQKCIKAITSQKTKDRRDFEKWFSAPTILAFLVLCNAGIFLIDHIHFQYNGFLTGILLLSIAAVLQNENIKGAFWFSVLLNFKHIYVYIAPVYFVYLLRSYCFDLKNSAWSFHLKRLILLGVVVLSIFGITYGPFAFQLGQVFSRMFPFENRGLCHAYWAPNFWALYNIVDKILSVIARRLDIIHPEVTTIASMTGGLVKEFEHTILPTIMPKVTLLCTLLAITPALLVLIKQPNQPRVFVRAIVLCAFASFIFGWHVHEKAILMVIIPYSLLAILNPHDARLFLILSITGHVSLFPLLFTPFENVIKVVVIAGFSIASYSFLAALHYDEKAKVTLVNFKSWEKIYLAGLVFVGLFESCLHSFFDPLGHLPFLPLLIMSVYCSVGILYVWVLLSFATLKSPKKSKVK
nr:EOG090X06YP [Moina brachiata]